MLARLLRLIAGASVAALLAACGGGAGTLVLQPVAQPEARPTFNLQAAFNNSITDNATLQFKVEGTAAGMPYDGSGATEQSMLHTVSEFDSAGGALRKLTPVKMTLQVSGRQVNVETVVQDFYTRSDLRLLGRIGPAPELEFVEVDRWLGLPAEAQVGASGTLYTATRYSDTGKHTVRGATVATWSLQPDAADDSALLVVRVADNAADGRPGTLTTTVYRITQAGTAHRVSETTSDAGNRTTLKALYL